MSHFNLSVSFQCLQTTYDWLALDRQVISDAVWMQSAANRINASKTNVDFGYKTLDMTTDPKVYKKARRHFESAVEGCFFDLATEV